MTVPDQRPRGAEHPLSKLDDSTLWTRVTRGHEQAFDALFVRHHDPIYNYCYRRTANWATAEDLMAATFFEMWRQRDRFTVQGESALPLLYGIAANLLRRQRRSLKAFERAVQKAGATVAAEQATQELPGDLLAERDLAEKAVAALTTLKPIDRDVLSLRIFGSLSYVEIAEALNIAPGTVASRISRAVARLGDEPSLQIDGALETTNAQAGKKDPAEGMNQVTTDTPAPRDAASDWSNS